MKSVQDLMIEELLEEDDLEEQDSNEIVEVLEFIRDNAVPLTSDQLKGIWILQEQGLGDLANFVIGSRAAVTPAKKYFDVINSITMGNRIKGNAKLSSLLKANMSSNPMQAYSQEMKKVNRNLKGS